MDLKCRSMRDNLLFFGIPEVIAHVQVDDSGNHGQMEHSDEHGLQTQGAPRALPLTVLGFIHFFSTMSHCLLMLTRLRKKRIVKTRSISFVKNVLKIKDARSRFKIDRAHRIGGRSEGKTRPIVAKFLLTEHKNLIKSALAKTDLKTAFNGVFKLNDQFPPEVVQRRKELIPRLISERQKGNKAALVRDKFYINNIFE